MIQNIVIIVAYDKQKAIGKDNQLLWHLPNDLKRFKKLTTGNTIIMGRKTYESIGKPLPLRENIVITRKSDLVIPGVIIAHSLQDALQKATSTHIFIIGGGEIYKQALPLAHELQITVVDTQQDADTFFPDWDENQWTLSHAEEHPPNDTHAYPYTFLHWIRNQK